MFPKTSRFLIVDDSSTMRKMIMNMLKDLGYTDFTEADNGRVGLIALRVAKSENKAINVIISDWNMPGMTGIDMLQAVRNESALANTPFLIISAEADAATIDKAKQLKVDAYITKPFFKQDLENHLKTVFEQTKNVA